MKKIFKNSDYLVVIISLFIALITLVTLFFTSTKLYFSLVFGGLVVISFITSTFVLLHKSQTNDKLKLISLYLLINWVFLCLDTLIVSKIWDMNVYGNLMFVTNMNVYLGIYAIYVIAMALITIYGIIKSITHKNNSTNSDK